MIDLKSAADRSQAIAAFRAGDYVRATALATDALARNKNDRDIQEVLGQCHLRTGRYIEARKLYLKLAAARPKDPGVLTQLGYVYLWSGNVPEAHAQFDKVMSLAPNFIPGVAGKADVYNREGNHEAIERLLHRYIDEGTENATMAVAYARTLLHSERYEEATTLTRKHLANPQLDNISRHILCEMTAKAYEKLGQFEQAFALFSDSNAIKARSFDAAEYIARVDEMMSVFAPQNLAKLPRSRLRSDLPLFVASMPRSGSTLVEQIIHAHPKAFGAGEIVNLQKIAHTLGGTLTSMWTFPRCLGDLRQEHVDAVAKRYLDDLRRFDRRALRIVNKHIDNDWYLGLIELLLPGARIVHVKRDPLDNCFSIFMAQMSVSAYPWSTDLRHIAIAYKQHERLMAHWRDVLSIPILEVQYEDLVDETETWIRKIIDFCGLPWDDHCLRYWEAERTVMTLSYDQVNKPIYKSAVKRWQKYEQFLGPLREELALK